ncbi:tRNA 5-methylaminomethyl-2-thiouridine biosynthesis bifunctional protein MnmC [Porphyridium purpureum]|uniref:tRNA 5-methylaminomethyl-2-thiouridine biosynthesis bifunctional protein MnmC n=1 Tax=Porphyridium purpureum TaxID=35688 RepID=A0A5J4YNY7_PORPP|nr:tRNA 5-methylaminomethyl-2-thiouridine biosynthesis bifunctional protein MnmC [Porphyridium purpureum]|eukprot:POR1372..scf222_8
MSGCGFTWCYLGRPPRRPHSRVAKSPQCAERANRKPTFRLNGFGLRRNHDNVAMRAVEQPAHDRESGREVASALICGGGLAGLAVAYQLCVRRGLRVFVVDPIGADGVGTGGASAVAAGLLHPFSPRMTRAWMGAEAFESAMRLVHSVQQNERERGGNTSAEQPVWKNCGILRLLRNDVQVDQGRASANAFGPDEVQFLDADQVCARMPPTDKSAAKNQFPGVFIPQGNVVDVPRYLRGLWRLCEQTGRATWVKRAIGRDMGIHTLAAELGVDHIVVAAGAWSKMLAAEELATLGIVPVRGQNLHLTLCSDQSSTPTRDLEFALISEKYVVPGFVRNIHPDGKNCSELICGATFEYARDGVTEDDLFDLAADLSSPQIGNMCGFIEQNLYTAPVSLCGTDSERDPITATDIRRRAVAGVRAVPKRSHLGSVPYAGKSGDIWYLTALGSRGLLYHNFLAEALADAVVDDDYRIIPSAARRAMAEEVEGRSESISGLDSHAASFAYETQ